MLAAALLLPAVNAAAGAAAIARTDANSVAAHAQLLQKAHAGRIELYFLGDSITRRWGTADPQYHPLYANWLHNFQGWNAADFGWGGDTTANILWRVEHGELDGVNPRVIVLLAGTNDLGTALARHERARDTEHEVVAGIAALVRSCRARAPQATLILTAITPRIDHRELLPLIGRINRHLAGLADGRHVRYLDIGPQLLDAHGDPHPGMLNPDGLHLAVDGYQPPPSRDPGLDH